MRSHFWDRIVAPCYHFLLISFSLFCVCLLPKSLLSPLSLLLCHTISLKLLPLPLTISTNSFTTTIFLLFLSSFSLSLVLSVPLSFWCLSLRQVLHSSPKHAAAVILQTHMFSPCHHYHRYLHPHCPIRIRFLHHPITLWSLRYLHTHMQPPISCSLSTPFLFIVSLVLSVHSLLFLSFSLCLSVSPSLRILSSWILGVTRVWCSVWLGCGGFLWVVGRGSLWWFVVGLCGGSVSGFCDLISVSFNFSGFDWFWWVLDFDG